MSRNNVILFFITVLTLSLSGFLFYSGFKSEEFAGRLSIKNVPAITLDPVPSPDAVLGEQNISSASSTQEIPSTENETSYLVTKIADGDTIEVLINNVKFSVRYIGIDTPETVDPRRPVGCFGKEASNENKRLVLGKRVKLEKDVSDKDKYNRLLRYVYLKLDDGATLFINDYLVRQGFAFAYTYPPDIKFNDQFVKAQTEARENRRGLWGVCD